jgi:hypothetical protein
VKGHLVVESCNSSLHFAPKLHPMILRGAAPECSHECRLLQRPVLLHTRSAAQHCTSTTTDTCTISTDSTAAQCPLTAVCFRSKFFIDARNQHQLCLFKITSRRSQPKVWVAQRQHPCAVHRHSTHTCAILCAPRQRARAARPVVFITRIRCGHACQHDERFHIQQRHR